jgi:Helix-loop-helix DNA-binding domain
MSASSPSSSDSPSLSDSPSFGVDDPNESFLSQLTPSDPLSYLLRMDSSTDSSQGHSPAEQDWSPFASWLENVSIPQDKTSDMGIPPTFDFSIPMNLDFDSSMAIDPSSLHFNTSIFTQHQPEATPTFDPLGPFNPDSFTQVLNQRTMPTHRRLSITSSSSSSGASFSPVVKSHSTPGSSVAGDTSSNEDAGAELAQRVLQAAGAAFFVPGDVKAEFNSELLFFERLSIIVTNIIQASQPKMPIPRIPKPIHAVPTPAKLSPSTSPIMQADPGTTMPTVSASTATSVLGRLKTSHTTIERRYRTNLNARITGLKQSVPALRVLEARLSGKESTETDIVDERGFVDGVKVGRKMSKANVLGKATEYIKYALTYFCPTTCALTFGLSEF